MAVERKVDVTISAIDRLTGPAEQMRAALHRLTAPARTASAGLARIGEATGVNKLATGFRNLGSSVQATSRHLTGLVTSVAALSGLSLGTGLLAGGAVAKGFITTNAEFEKFQTALTTMMGSSDKAKEAMGWIEDFAVKTPYELREVTDAFVKLRAYGIDATDGTLEKMGDWAAGMAKPLNQAVEALADAMTGEFERLKELGVKGATVGNMVKFTFTDKNGKERIFQALKDDRKAIQKAIMASIDARGLGGAGAALAKTWDGLISNLSDMWSGFLRSVGNSGLFDYLKSKLSALLDQLNILSDTGELTRWAKIVSDKIVSALQLIEAKLTSIDWVGVWEDFSAAVSRAWGWVEKFVGAVGGWENAFYAVVAVMNAGLITSLVTLGVQLAALLPGIIAFAASASAAIVSAIVAMTSAILLNPVGLAITAIVVAVAGLAYAIYDNWGPISAFVTQLWADIQTAFSAGWAWLQGLPGAMEQAWGSLPSFVATLWGDITGLFAQAVAWFEQIDLAAVGSGIVASLLDGLRGAWSGVTSWVSGAVNSLSGMLPGFVRDQLGIPAPAGSTGDQAPASPLAPRSGQSAASRLPLFAKGAAPVPNVWDVVSGDAVPAKGSPAQAATVSAPVNIVVNTNGVSDAASLAQPVKDAVEKAMREWTRQVGSGYGLLAD